MKINEICSALNADVQVNGNQDKEVIQNEIKKFI